MVPSPWHCCSAIPSTGSDRSTPSSTGPRSSTSSASGSICGSTRAKARRNLSDRRDQIMSHFLDRLSFFNRVVDDFADGHGIVTREDRRWEDGYRKRWQHDKIVRSTHGANCTGSCSWKIYVKGGIVTWETH